MHVLCVFSYIEPQNCKTQENGSVIIVAIVILASIPMIVSGIALAFWFPENLRPNWLIVVMFSLALATVEILARIPKRNDSRHWNWCKYFGISLYGVGILLLSVLVRTCDRSHQRSFKNLPVATIE